MAFDRLEDGPQFKREDEELMLSFAASAATAVHTARSVAEERLAHALEGAEQERRRWARELHDETLQGLGGLQLLLSSALKEQDAEKRAAVVRRASEQVRMEISNLRNLILELRPAELDELGLESALEALAERRAAANGLRVAVDIDLGSAPDGGPARLAPSVESTVYRIVQEALSNAAKHSGAERIDVHLVASNGMVELVVRDNGDGFDLAKPTSGYGLLGMRERVALLRGDFQIASAPEQGTTVRAVFPAARLADQ
jgi:signal transduction histidine kinase